MPEPTGSKDDHEDDRHGASYLKQPLRGVTGGQDDIRREGD